MKSRSLIKAVSFDVGGTLIRPWPSVGHVYAEAAEKHGFPNISPDLLNQRFKAAWRACKNFDYTEHGWEVLVNDTFAGACGSTVPFFRELYRRFAEPTAWQIFDDVFPALDRLAAADIRLVVTSNWDERLRGLLKALCLDAYFESLIISCEIGFPKPSPVIFQHTAMKLGLAPQTVLHIGDSLEMDVIGAREAGFNALHLRRSGGMDSHEIRSLTEVAERVAGDKVS